MPRFSIITQDFNHCYLCNATRNLELHHIFNGANRDKSTKYGLVVPLCHYCHNEPPNGVHYNQKNNLYLKRIGQKAFMEHYPNEDFMELFHKNYL